MKSGMMLQISRWKLSSYNRFYSGKGNRRGLQKKYLGHIFLLEGASWGMGSVRNAYEQALIVCLGGCLIWPDRWGRKEKEISLCACPFLPHTLWKLLVGTSADIPQSSRVPALIRPSLPSPRHLGTQSLLWLRAPDNMAGRRVASLPTERIRPRPLFYLIPRDTNLMKEPGRFSPQPGQSGLLPETGQGLLAEHQNTELKNRAPTLAERLLCWI